MQALLRKEAANLPPVSRSPGSGVGSNVLVFVAVLALLVVGIYVANKGKPKEATMFGGGGPPPSMGTPAASSETAPSPAAGEPVSGVVELEEGAEVPAGAVLFVTVRPAAAGGKGPPLAVERRADPSFPHAFDIGPEDRMIASMPWSGPVDVEARLDLDGNAMTRSPGDLTSGPGASNVTLGSADVTLVLRPGE